MQKLSRRRRGEPAACLPGIALRGYFCDAICRKHFYRKQDFSARSFSTKLMISEYLKMTHFISTIFPTFTRTFSSGPVKIFFSFSSYFRLQLRTETGWQRSILKNLRRSQHQKAQPRGLSRRRSLKRPAPRPRGSAPTTARPGRPRLRSWRRPPTA